MSAAASVAASITHLVSAEMIEGLISTLRMWASVAVMRIEVVINDGRGNRASRGTKGQLR